MLTDAAAAAHLAMLLRRWLAPASQRSQPSIAASSARSLLRRQSPVSAVLDAVGATEGRARHASSHEGSSSQVKNWSSVRRARVGVGGGDEHGAELGHPAARAAVSTTRRRAASRAIPKPALGERSACAASRSASGSAAARRFSSRSARPPR